MSETSSETGKLLGDNTFKIRLAIAGLFVLIVILFDITDKTFAGITTGQLYDVIATDYGNRINNFIETLKNTPNE